MWRCAPTRLLRRASTGLAPLQGASAATQQLLHAVVKRIPAGGMPAATLQSLLADEFPSFTPATVGALTLKEALQGFPELFTVEGGRQGGPWWVRPSEAVAGRAQPAASTAASPDQCSSSRMTEDYQRVRQSCLDLAKSQGGSRGVYFPLEDVLRHSGVSDVDVIDQIMAPHQSGLDVRLDIHIRPKRASRSAVVFIDGDELPASAIEAMFDALQLQREQCTTCVVRRLGSNPVSSVDIVCPEGVPTYLGVERQARALRLREQLVLRDVVYMCSARQFQSYAEHVSPLNSFPDADVYVCCPSKARITQARQVIPF